MRYQAPRWTTIALTAAFALAASAALAFSTPVEMRVDGQAVVSDVPPVPLGPNALFVPIRPVSDALGAETKYEPKSGEVTVSRGDQVLHLKVGATHATLNGMPMTLKHAPFRVRGRVMLGLHAVGRAFGLRVKYDKKSARAYVSTPGMPQPQEEAP